MNTSIPLALLALLIVPALDARAQEHAQHHPPSPPAHVHADSDAKATTQDDAPPSATPQDAVVPMDHAAMGHGTPAATPADHASMDHASMDHASMDHGSMDHSRMDHASMGHAPPPGSMPEPVPVPTDADRAAARAPNGHHPMHDNTVQSFVSLDRLERFEADGGVGVAWEAHGWLGTDVDRLWLRSEGERVAGHTERADLEALYGRAISPWWDLVAGVRHDIVPGASQDFIAVGVQGMAPYKFEVKATAYLGASGQTAARVEAAYELLLTNRLILQPMVEAELHGKDDPRRGIGAGLGTVEVGLRLRHEVTRQFAPYLGIVRERAFGRTATWRRARGETTDDSRVVAGVRLWF